MPLSWNEIKTRAAAFGKEWENEVSEDAEAKSFWDDFFNVFGIGRRRVATFEQQVKKIDNKTGFIDLLWKGVILVEHKSRGKDLDRAFQQAKDYFPGLKEKELPRYILVSDFERFRLYDLEENTHHEFRLTDFVNHVHLFCFIAGYQKRTYKEQDPVNIEAAELMGKLHDKLKAIGYTGHHLELYLVRLLFCLFADDTSIFEKGILSEYLELKTNEDGSDLAAHISQLFQVLNTEENKRFKNLDEALAAFPYINGKLFEEQLPMAHFDGEMRRILLDCCLLDWGKISPAIFGSLFQSVMDATARRNLGAHYTSEKNILKLIKPLFLDELWAEFNKVKSDKGKLKKLHDKISKLRFLDPACGCGNFLIIAYRELRLLELDIVKALLKGQQITSVNDYFLVDVDRFYGIEYEEFPSQIAQVAMWLMDHQMNEQASVSFGEYYKRIPLKKSATIVHGNALRIDWQSLIEPMPWEKQKSKYHYILGNPPFIGKHLQNTSQKSDMDLIFQGVNGAGNLDYVSTWYIKAAQYMQLTNVQEERDLPKSKTAFVSTNSVAQGEQVGILWKELFNRYHIKIHFAHRTFKWGNEAKGNAAVHVVIIGFSNYDITEKLIYEYEDIKGEPHEIKVKNINPYLVEGKDVFVSTNKKPICNVPELIYGNKPVDGGFLFLTSEEKKDLLSKEPGAKKYIRRIYGSQEYINNIDRWCIWLVNANPTDIKNMPEILKRIESVKKMRLASTKAATIRLASTPSLFAEIRQPNSDFLIIPRVSSERRKYIPIGLLDKDIIVNDLVSIVPNATMYEFGILGSIMHMAWVKYVCGRLESRYRYSNDIVYNNFPWPENSTPKQKKTVEKAAQAVLDIRASFPSSSLADLYDPNTMPPALVKAHTALDKAVDLCYRSQPFINETKRIEFLFELYDKYTAGLFVKEKKGKKK
jgi:N-6 DNA Methylase